jgi:type I restriction-modification system DNA methylase subunit
LSGSSFKFTQLSFASEVKDWINEITHSLSLRFDCADIEVKDPSKKRADVILWEKRPVKPALLIEIWDAKTPPWEYALDSALSKAWKNNIPHFVVWNLTHFYCWETFAGGEAIDKLWWPHSGVSEVVCEALTYDDAILKYDESIKKYLETFLREFEQVYYGIKAKPLLSVDERLIYRLRGAIHALSIPIFEHIKKIAAEDVEFKSSLGKYFREQDWSFKWVDEDFEKVARQYVYLLVNKILFYNVLRSMPDYGRHLPKITIPEVGLTGRILKDKLDGYFKKAFDITGDYETILLTDFLDSLTPPDDVASVLKDFIHKIGEYDFSKINYEILGNIFQRLIPEDERHKLGQYFTRSDVVDLIVGFCVRSADDKVLDGGCGAGTFLVRSYVRKKLLDPRKTHRDLIKDLYGIDIAKFPAHLSIINLASRDLSEIENHPNILHRDFFDTLPGKEYLSAKVRVETLSGREKFIKMPEAFDAVVMNPPYTRQEEMEDILEEEKKKAYKKCIEDWKAMSKYPMDKEPKLSKRSSIYVHFFIHGGSFLKEGGRLGLITSNSWLDVDYGGDLQRFFLENFKIKAIIESKVERWFEDADINTAITILERCSNPEERNNNVVRFVQLKKPLVEFIPPVEDENERWAYVERLIEFIEGKKGYYEDDRIRVFTKRQKELWDEGYDDEEGEYVGSKWGKYIRAPNIFFKILDKGKNVIVPLKQIAKVNPGIKSGADTFFYLKKEQIEKWKIENEYVKHLVIKSIRECKKIAVKDADLKYRVLLVNKRREELKNTNVMKYIDWGESLGLSNPQTNPTCGRRTPWYDLGKRTPAPILWPDVIFERYISPYNEANALADYDLHEVRPFDNSNNLVVCALLNCTLTALFAEMNGRVNLGQGSLKMQSHEIATMFIINPSVIPTVASKEIKIIFMKLKEREIENVFREIGASSPEEVSLDKVKPDRRELDRIIMGEILGLTEEEQLEVYRAVIDLVKSRIERAKSIQKRRKVGELDIDELVDSVLKDVESLHGIQAKRFPEDYIGDCPYRVVEVPRGSKVEAGIDLEGPYVQIDGERIKCGSIYEARFIEYAVLAGKTKVTIPTDEDVLKRAVEERTKLLKDARARLEEFLNETIADRKLREKVRFEAFRRLGI